MHPATPPIGQPAQGRPGEQPSPSAAATGYPSAPVGGKGPAPVVSEPAEGWQAAYEKANRKSRIFMATTGVAAVLALGLGAWEGPKPPPHPVSASRDRATRRRRTGRYWFWRSRCRRSRCRRDTRWTRTGMGSTWHRRPRRGPGMGGLASNFFNSDGSVNQAQVEQLKQMLSSGNGPTLAGFKNLLTHAVTDGELTQAQADKLLAALGSQAAPPEAANKVRPQRRRPAPRPPAPSAPPTPVWRGRLPSFPPHGPAGVVLADDPIPSPRCPWFTQDDSRPSTVSISSSAAPTPPTSPRHRVCGSGWHVHQLLRPDASTGRTRPGRAALDLPGFGRSEADISRDYSLERHARAVIDFLRLQEGPVNLVGNFAGRRHRHHRRRPAPRPGHDVDVARPGAAVLQTAPGPTSDPAGVAAACCRLLERTIGEQTPEQRVDETMKLCFGDPSRIPPHRRAEAINEHRLRAGLPHIWDAFVESSRGLGRGFIPWGRNYLWNRLDEVEAPVLCIFGTSTAWSIPGLRARSRTPSAVARSSCCPESDIPRRWKYRSRSTDCSTPTSWVSCRTGVRRGRPQPR